MGTTYGAVVRSPGSPWEITELVYDDPKEHEVLVRLRAAGLCHSDDHVRTGDTPLRYPIIGGHEGAGIVEAVGASVTRVTVGQRVMATFVPVCGVCPSCSAGMQNLCDRGLNAGTGQMTDGTFRFRVGDEELGGFCTLGTFAERMVVSENSLFPVPDDIPFEVAALMSCGVPTGWGSAVRAAGVTPGQTVVVLGAGGVGMHAVQGAALAGAGRVVVVDPVAFKRDKALELGATSVFEDVSSATDYVREATWGRMADVAIITVGVLAAQHVTDAIGVIGKRGQVVVTSMGPMMDMPIQASGMLLATYEQVIRGTLFGSCQPLRDLGVLMDLYRAGKLKIDELITRRYSLEQVNEGYADMNAGKNIRGVITFPV